MMEPGRRTVLSIFEYYAAHDSERLWALLPIDNDDLIAGFSNITYKACIDAVDNAIEWLEKVLPASGSTFDAFAYQGPSDLRVLLTCLAAAKMRKQVLLPSRRASPNAQRHLVQTAKCVALIHANGTDAMFDCAEAGVKPIVAPELSDWLHTSRQARSALSALSWEEAQDTPWILLHTSGTTGLPKIVRYTHKMMAKFDAPFPVDEGPTPNELLAGGRWFTSIPLFHFVGLCVAFQLAPILGSICVLAPVIKGPPVLSAQQLVDLIGQTEPFGLLMPPADIGKLTATETGMAALKKVRCVNFVGAQLRKSVGDKLLQNGNIVIYGLGTTEAGGYPQLLRSDAEWDWFTFPQCAGVTFERYAGNEDVYELVFYKNPELERLQQVFLAFPELDVLRTKDLYYRHPVLKNTWKLAGRSDDFFKPLSGYGIFATPVEEAILEKGNDLISAVLMAGAGYEQPCLLAMPKTQTDPTSLIERLWPVVAEVNKTLQEPARIKKELILVADLARPFQLNGKGAASRRETLIEYEKDIAQMYSTV